MPTVQGFLAILLVPVFLLGCSIVGEQFRVEGNAMAPTLRAGTLVNVNKTDQFRRGDIIVFEFPRGRNRTFIKRVIGLPGETVEIKDNKVFINGQPLDEPYLSSPDDSHMSPIFLQEGEYFVLGDNRRGSNDSRNWGPVPRENIHGVVQP